MAKLSTLGAAIARSASDLFYFEQGGVEKQIRLDQLSYSGTFTPVIEGLTTAGTNTYDIQSGYYSKVGDIVICFGRIRMTTKDAAMSGDIRIGGLPFTVKSNPNGYAPISISYEGNFTLTSGAHLVGHAVTSTAQAELWQTDGGSTRTVITDAQINNNTELMFLATYQAA